MVWMSNNELYRRIERQIDFQKDDIRSYLEVTIDIQKRLEATLANEKENRALKEHVEKLKERIGELEKENEWLRTRLEISMEDRFNLIKEILKKGD